MTGVTADENAKPCREKFGLQKTCYVDNWDTTQAGETPKAMLPKLLLHLFRSWSCISSVTDQNMPFRCAEYQLSLAHQVAVVDILFCNQGNIGQKAF